MPGWNAYSYVFGPLLAFGGLGILVLLLRWTFRRGASLVAAPGKPGKADEYGVLVPVASPPSYADGEMWRRHLEAHGIRANLAQTKDGPRLLVWPDDESAARTMLATIR